MIAADVVRAVALLTIPCAAFLGHVTLPLLLTVAVVTGRGGRCSTLSPTTCSSPGSWRPSACSIANGKREAVDAIAEISGPVWAARSSRAHRSRVDRRRRVTFVISALLLGSDSRSGDRPLRLPLPHRSPTTSAPAFAWCGATQRYARSFSRRRRSRSA
jgi:hypothetical protein